MPWLLLCLCLLLAACDVGQTARAGGSSSPVWSLEETFERDRYWTLDSAGNHGELDYAVPTDDGFALAVRATDHGRGNGILRKEVDWDASGLQALALDVHLAGPGTAAIAVALRSQRHQRFETAAIPLAPGWQRHLVIPLEAFAATAAWREHCDHIARISLLVQQTDGSTCVVTVDNLRTLATTPVGRRPATELVLVERSPATTLRFCTRRWRLTLRFPAVAVTGRDPAVLQRMLGPKLQLVDPAGRELSVDAFCTGVDAAGMWCYECRFTPELAGTWRSQLAVPDGIRWTWLDPETWTCEPVEGSGFIRVDPSHPQYLQDSTGAFFWPLGQNICWASDMESWFAQLAGRGGNLARIWICPWNNDLALDKRLDEIDQGAAAALDVCFATAARHGIRIQLVLGYHGLLAGDWGNNPYNRINGGGCALPEEFWIRDDARQAYRQFLRYVVARWGASPQLFAWELWNEVNLTKCFADEDIVTWHRTMTDFLQVIDVHDHPVTTSCSSSSNLTAIWGLAGIDLIQVHAYRDEALSELRKPLPLAAAHRKPLFMAEFGRDWAMHRDQADERGAHLRQGLWLSWMLPYAGSTMPWWWDTHVEPRGLLGHYAAFARYIAGEDRRTMDLRSVAAVLTTGDDVRVQALIGRSRAYAYVFAQDSLDRQSGQIAPSLLPDGGRLELHGLADGTWRVEVWDDRDGTVVAAFDAQAVDGWVQIDLPPVEESCALKLVRSGALEAGVTITRSAATP